MTITPVDKGYAFIKNNSDGTIDVLVAATLQADGNPDKIVSVHYNRPAVDLGNAVRTVKAGSMLRTSEPTLVRSEADEVVRIRVDR
ncbi:hypothetical protein [Streptomyces cyslabdanicus]|uniref:hypothetical protein n=1 Tax=Streptomyces cyslabdanicus TaxID=1470456 RepID=UPI004044E18C